jgi:hypothetical protein
VFTLELKWDRPTIVFYHERIDKAENDPFVVVKAQRLSIESSNKELKGNIKDFFPLMGDLDSMLSPQGKENRYVLCWFDDNVVDFEKSFRKLNGVMFHSGLLSSEKGKETFNGSFKARSGNIE